MRIIDRLIEYLEFQKITPYQVERELKVANGYIKKQHRGKGSIGSDILQRIYGAFPDLNFMWLLLGQGEMLNDEEYSPIRFTSDEMIEMLNARISILEKCLSDKEEIIKHLKDKYNLI